MISSLFLLIPAAVLVVVGVWGLRNASTQASAYPGLDEKTQNRRRGTYVRGSVTCLVVAALFVLLTILSFL